MVKGVPAFGTTLNRVGAVQAADRHRRGGADGVDVEDIGAVPALDANRQPIDLPVRGHDGAGVGGSASQIDRAVGRRHGRPGGKVEVDARGHVDVAVGGGERAGFAQVISGGEGDGPGNGQGAAQGDVVRGQAQGAADRAPGQRGGAGAGRLGDVPAHVYRGQEGNIVGAGHGQRTKRLAAADGAAERDVARAGVEGEDTVVDRGIGIDGGEPKSAAARAAVQVRIGAERDGVVVGLAAGGGDGAAVERRGAGGVRGQGRQGGRPADGPPKVVAPAVLTASAKAPSTVEPNVTLPPPVELSVVPAPSVTASP